MVRAMSARLVFPVAVGLTLLGVVAVSEAWGYRPGPSGEPDAEDPAELRRRQVLERLAAEPNLLINLDPYDVPATSDIIRLGKKATPAVVNGLVNSMSPAVRTTCALVLSATRDPRALDPLLDALDDPEVSVRYRALDAIGSIEGRKAIPRLLALLAQRGTPPDLREQVVWALGRLGDPSAVAPLLTHFKQTWDPATQRALWDLREHLGPKLNDLVTAPLAAGERNPPPDEVLLFAVERAGDLRVKSVVNQLVKLADERPPMRNRVIYNLGRMGDPAALPYLKGLLDTTAEARLLNNVLFALQRMGQDVRPFLAKGLADRRAYIRFNAAFVAGDLRVTSLVPQLVAALQDPNDYVRSEVAVALGKVGSREAVEPLTRASHEPNATVRRDALLALARMDEPAHRGRVVTELVASPQRSIRVKAVEQLAERPDPAVVSPVLAVLDPWSHQDRDLGLALLDKFDRLDNPDATAFLLRVAAGEPSHAHDALRVLARFRDERARFILRQWLHAPGGEQDQMLRALGLLADRPSDRVARAHLAGKDVATQLYAAFLLASLGEQEGADHLVGALEQSPVELKRTAALLLTELDLARVPGVHDSLVKMLAHPDVYVRLYAARALSHRAEPAAWRQLKVELDKRVPFIRDDVLDIAERAPRARARPVLEGWVATAGPGLKGDLQRILERE
jgi:HEAT repeat protein